MSAVLLPCPFCNNAAKTERLGGAWLAQCEHCASSSGLYREEKLCVTAWNGRFADLATPAVSSPAADGAGKPHFCTNYIPDPMAGGSDCALCGHPQETHSRPAPAPVADEAVALAETLLKLCDDCLPISDDDAAGAVDWIDAAETQMRAAASTLAALAARLEAVEADKTRERDKRIQAATAFFDREASLTADLEAVEAEKARLEGEVDVARRMALKHAAKVAEVERYAIGWHKQVEAIATMMDLPPASDETAAQVQVRLATAEQKASTAAEERDEAIEALKPFAGQAYYHAHHPDESATNCGFKIIDLKKADLIVQRAALRASQSTDRIGGGE